MPRHSHPAHSRLIALLLLAACGVEGVTGPSGEFELPGQAFWPGESLTIISEDFRDFGDGATLTFGDEIVPLARVDATTMSAPVPLAAASVEPVLHLAGSSYTLPAITVAGYLDSQDYPDAGRIVWDAYALTLGGQPHVIGGNILHQLGVVNLATGAAQSIPASLDYDDLRGPGMTEQPGVWILRDGGMLSEWQLGSAVTKLRDVSEFTPPFTRQVARFGPNSWLVTTGNSWAIHHRPDDQSPWTVTQSPGFASEPEGVHLSPRRDRAVLRVDRIAAGVPVFDTEAAGVAYTTSFKSVQGIDFSADGAVLALVGGKGDGGVPPIEGGGSVIELLDAATGAVRATAALEHRAFAVAFDDEAERVFVGMSTGSERNWRPVILVLDAADLSEIATLAVPDSSPTCASIFDCLGGVLAVSGEHLYAFSSWNGPPHSWRFRLLP